MDISYEIIVDYPSIKKELLLIRIFCFFDEGQLIASDTENHQPLKMKVHTTNYKDTFIEIAEDCPAISGEIPPINGNTKTVANLQYGLLSKNPYRFTSDEDC